MVTNTVELQAGTELDLLIHRQVMGHGFVFVDGIDAEAEQERLNTIPPYSTDIAAAWKIVAHFSGSARDGRCVIVGKTAPDEWHCEIGGGDDEGPTVSHHGVGPTPMLAICRAALVADSN